jgi:DNA-directed DNA polymerase III PolC
MHGTAKDQLPPSDPEPARPLPTRRSHGGGAFVPLTVRSHYSFLDSTLAVTEVVRLAGAAGFPAVGLCDRGNLHGAVEFALAARVAGVKPVHGIEVRVGEQPLWLYVESQRGYTTLCRWLSTARGATVVRRVRAGEGEGGGSSGEPARRRSGGTDQGSRQDARSTAQSRQDACTTTESGRDVRSTADLEDGDEEGDSTGREEGGLPDFGRFLGGAGEAPDTTGLIAVAADPGLARCFPGRFYQAIRTRGELRRHDRATGLPAVPVLPVHYAVPGDRGRLEVLQAIRTRTLLRQAHPEKLGPGHFHFRTATEVARLFAGRDDLLAHTVEVAERCQFEVKVGPPQFPAFVPPDESTAHEFLRRLVVAGAERRYPASRQAAVREQIEVELGIIAAVGYEEYFLIVWDLLGECRARGIEWITRGSAADSLVCYCLGISDVCPIRFELYFRRFLNQERMALNKLPDIDIDFPHDRKDDVVDLLFAKYGPEHCAVVGGFSTFRARSAFAEVAKVLGVAEREVRRFTEHFPWSSGGGGEGGGGSPKGDGRRAKGEGRRAKGGGGSPKGEGRLAALLRARPETSELPVEEEPFRTALAVAEWLEGRPRYAKMHPCGVVLSRQPLCELTPTFVSGKGWPATDFDMDAVEAIGLVKMDILAQGGLAVMRDTWRALAARESAEKGRTKFKDQSSRKAPTAQGEERAGALGLAPGASLDALSFDLGASASLLVPAERTSQEINDTAVWDLIAAGDARAVHHIESPAMTSLCRMCDVRDIDTLVAIVSVIRPGAANEDKKREFTRRYQGLRPVEYAHPSLEPVLRSTFGLVVYEEHILQICEAFAGLPGGRADVLRRALVKEQWPVVGEIRKAFFACAAQRGRSEAETERVWELVTGFHGYAFCKAHSAAYGVEAYQAAWLKRNHPAEFLAGVLTNGKGFYRPLVYVLECWRLGIPLMPPWVNEPGPGFRVARDAVRGVPAIRVPVAYVAGLTEGLKARIQRERDRGEFASLADFYVRVQPGAEEIEALSRAGALDGFGSSRCEQFWEIQALKARWEGAATVGQGWLMAPGSGGPGRLSTVLEEPSRLQCLQWETELLGFPASGHPLELHPEVAWETYCPVERLREFAGQEVTLCGLVIEDRLHHQAGGEPMKFLTLCDWTGMVETELFARTYRSYGRVTVRYPVLEVTGRVEPFENGQGQTLRVLRAGKPRNRAGAAVRARS